MMTLILISAFFTYVGIGGLVAVWIDYHNQDLDAFDQLPVLSTGALWLPMAVFGIIAILANMASGAAKPRR